MTTATRLPIRTEHDIVAARQHGRELAERTGFEGSELTVIATAISELARNIVQYAERGEMEFAAATDNGRRGIVIVATDEGPGIPDVERALEDGYSTSRSLGLGLPGARRLMDEFEISSTVGEGTTIKVTKWVSEPS